MIRTLAVASLLLLPLSALADEPQCKFNAPRELKLDLAGAKAVVFEVNQHDLVLTAGPGPAQLGGRACASNADWLRELTVTASWWCGCCAKAATTSPPAATTPTWTCAAACRTPCWYR
jgi:hypothetical protein